MSYVVQDIQKVYARAAKRPETEHAEMQDVLEDFLNTMAAEGKVPTFIVPAHGTSTGDASGPFIVFSEAQPSAV
ncbi:hypothetical protein GCM10023350_13060 [Nocardioides endophyticus]|uniref:Uncharacterized protein n=1 Tax=Nocardioides endophyticus TaxID=1353775 RepID=A0ABP8YKI6_9ACTN